LKRDLLLIIDERIIASCNDPFLYGNFGVSTHAYAKCRAKSVCGGAYAPAHTVFAASFNAG
jgi:hypothetical protein